MLNDNEKLLNYRPIILICANLILGILCTVTIYYSINLCAFLGCAFFIINLILIIFYVVKKEKRVFITLIISLLITILVCLTFLSKILLNLNVESVGNSIVYGEILSINSINDLDYGYRINAYVKVIGGQLNGKVIEVYFIQNNLLFEGYKVEFEAELNAYNVFYNNRINANALRYGVSYISSKNEIISSLLPSFP